MTLADTTLSEAVEEFNRYNRQQLMIGDDSIADLSVGDNFEVTGVGEFVRSLRLAFGIRSVETRAGGARASGVTLLGPAREPGT